MRIAIIFLVCATAFSSAQFQDEPKAIPIPLRATRYQRLPPATRPNAASQSIFSNQRIRRPISFKPKLNPGDDASSGTLRPVRPSISTAPATFTQQVKPVNEEPEEENITHESSRERHENDNSRDQTQESQSEEELSEENIPRPIPNFFRPSVGLGSPLPAPLQPISITAYRPLQQVVTAPTTRASFATTIPPPPPVQYRSTQKPTKAPRKQIVDDAFRQQIKAPLKPVKPSQAYEIRGKKPVAQIIRRYRHDNSDGSITWGFENDDGSYKEETIGVDCITSGKYGYVDPDGIRREYTYETGIKCDEQQREEVDDGFVDYQENKLVLPSGKTIDLSSMGKKQVRRPQPLYRN